MTQEATLRPRTDVRAAMTTEGGSLASADVVREFAQRSLQSATDHLLSLQRDDGHWCAELEGDSILQSEYILLKWIIEQENDPRLPWVANYLRSQQREDNARQRLRTDPHSPEQFRVNGVVRQMDAWYDAFDVTADDELYLPPAERVHIW